MRWLSSQERPEVHRPAPAYWPHPLAYPLYPNGRSPGSLTTARLDRVHRLGPADNNPAWAGVGQPPVRDGAIINGDEIPSLPRDDDQVLPDHIKQVL